MAIFGKDGMPNARPDSRAPGNTESADASALSVIASGLRIVGDLESVGLIKVEGRIEGSVTSARQVLLSRGATIQGSIIADEVVIAGTLNGGIRAGERLELQSTSVVNGDIETKSVIVLEGAQINGTMRMIDLGSARADGLPAETLRIVNNA